MNLPQKHKHYLAAIAQHGSARTHIEDINFFWNTQVQYKADEQTAKQKDHWQTPAETLQKGTGDCEDIAIGKYNDLKKLGYHPSLDYVLLRNKPKGQRTHIVCWCNDQYLDNQQNPWKLVFTFNDKHAEINGKTLTKHPYTILPQWERIVKAMEKL